MKKIYQRPQTDSYVIESEQLLDNLSVGKNNVTTVTNNNSTQFSRESGGWDDDY